MTSSPARRRRSRLVGAGPGLGVRPAPARPADPRRSGAARRLRAAGDLDGPQPERERATSARSPSSPASSTSQACWFWSGPGGARRLARGGGRALAAAAVCALAVASRLAPGAFPTKVARAFEHRPAQLPVQLLERGRGLGGMAIAMALAWSAHARSLAAARGLPRRRPICGSAAYLTYSRAAVIARPRARARRRARRNRWTLSSTRLAAIGAALAIVRRPQRHQDRQRHRERRRRGGLAGARSAGSRSRRRVAVATSLMRLDERCRMPSAWRQIAVVASVRSSRSWCPPPPATRSRAAGTSSATRRTRATPTDPAARLTT